MATYCSVRDVRLALTPSADAASAETASSLPDWQIEDAILEAEGVINTYVLARYTIPTGEVTESNQGTPPILSQVVVAPQPVRGWTRDVAAFLATLTFRKHKDLPEDDPVRLRYAMVLKMLEDIRDFKSTLPGGAFPPSDVDDDQGVHVENLYTGKLFGPEDFGLGYAGQVQSPQVYWSVQ